MNEKRRWDASWTFVLFDVKETSAWTGLGHAQDHTTLHPAAPVELLKVVIEVETDVTVEDGQARATDSAWLRVSAMDGRGQDDLLYNVFFIDGLNGLCDVMSSICCTALDVMPAEDTMRGVSFPLALKPVDVDAEDRVDDALLSVKGQGPTQADPALPGGGGTWVAMTVKHVDRSTKPPTKATSMLMPLAKRAALALGASLQGWLIERDALMRNAMAEANLDDPTPATVGA